MATNTTKWQSRIFGFVAALLGVAFATVVGWIALQNLQNSPGMGESGFSKSIGSLDKAVDRQDIATLTKALSDEDSRVRAAAADCLNRLGPKSIAAVPTLTDLANNDPNPSVRKSSIVALAAITHGEHDVLQLTLDRWRTAPDSELSAISEAMTIIGPACLPHLVDSGTSQSQKEHAPQIAWQAGCGEPVSSQIARQLIDAHFDPTKHQSSLGIRTAFRILMREQSIGLPDVRMALTSHDPFIIETGLKAIKSGQIKDASLIPLILDEQYWQGNAAITRDGLMMSQTDSQGNDNFQMAGQDQLSELAYPGASRLEALAILGVATEETERFVLAKLMKQHSADEVFGNLTLTGAHKLRAFATAIRLGIDYRKLEPFLQSEWHWSMFDMYFAARILDSIQIPDTIEDEILQRCQKEIDTVNDRDRIFIVHLMAYLNALPASETEFLLSKLPDNRSNRRATQSAFHAVEVLRNCDIPIKQKAASQIQKQIDVLLTNGDIHSVELGRLCTMLGKLGQSSPEIVSTFSILANTLGPDSQDRQRFAVAAVDLWRNNDQKKLVETIQSEVCLASAAALNDVNDEAARITLLKQYLQSKSPPIATASALAIAERPADSDEISDLLTAAMNRQDAHLLNELSLQAATLAVANWQTISETSLRATAKKALAAIAGLRQRSADESADDHLDE